MDEIAKARAKLAAIEARKELVIGVQTMFGSAAGICADCEAIVSDAVVHKAWHERNERSRGPG